MNSIVLPEARRDLRQALAYYEEQRPFLGDRFPEDFSAQRRFIEHFPMAAPVIYAGVRRRLFSTFEHGVFYTVEGDQIHILRVLHTAQSPETWPEVTV